MPRNTPCDHPNCDGGPCKALTPEELTPTQEDCALAKQLVDEGWMQTSAKYRMIRRWKSKPPTPEQLVNPEFRDTYFGKRAMERLKFDDLELRCAPDDQVEVRTLTLRQFKAYKNIKNAEWRALLRRVHGDVA